MEGAEHRLTEAQRQTLLWAAHDALSAAVTGRPPQLTAEETQGRLGEPGACFVTLYEQDNLRGCIGNLSASSTLSQMVRAMAAAAALRDPRFTPVSPAEVAGLRVSLSVLSPTRRITDPAEVVVGRHGLVISRGPRRGVLLPQVASERGWDRDTFLAQTCLKANLPQDAWKERETTLEVFSAEVFG